MEYEVAQDSAPDSHLILVSISRASALGRASDFILELEREYSFLPWNLSSCRFTNRTSLCLEHPQHYLEQTLLLPGILSVLWPWWENKSRGFILESWQFSFELALFVTEREKWSVSLSLPCRLNNAPGWVRNIRFALQGRGYTYTGIFLAFENAWFNPLQFPTFLFHLSCLIIRPLNNCCRWGGGEIVRAYKTPGNWTASVARAVLLWTTPQAYCEGKGGSFLHRTWLTLVHSVPKGLAKALGSCPWLVLFLLPGRFLIAFDHSFSSTH